MDDLVLYPGINNVTMRADVEQSPILTAVTTEPHCKDGVIPFELRGKDVEKHGERLDYFADALASLETKVDIGLKDAFARAGLEVGCDTGSSSSDDNDDEESSDN